MHQREPGPCPGVATRQSRQSQRLPRGAPDLRLQNLQPPGDGRGARANEQMNCSCAITYGIWDMGTWDSDSMTAVEHEPAPSVVTIQGRQAARHPRHAGPHRSSPTSPSIQQSLPMQNNTPGPQPTTPASPPLRPPRPPVRPLQPVVTPTIPRRGTVRHRRAVVAARRQRRLKRSAL